MERFEISDCLCGTICCLFRCLFSGNMVICRHLCWFCSYPLSLNCLRLVKTDNENRTSRRMRKEQKACSSTFLLYLNIPILYGLILFYFHTLHTFELATYEIVGMTCSVGLIVGTIGINVAHELGHRHNWFDQIMSRVLLTVRVCICILISNTIVAIIRM